MKKLLKRAGLEGKQTVFLFTDTQIVHETFLEVSAFASAAGCIFNQHDHDQRIQFTTGHELEAASYCSVAKRHLQQLLIGLLPRQRDTNYT